MKLFQRLPGLALSLILMVSATPVCKAGEEPPVRIMPLGDSITLGCCSGTPTEGGYRTRLYSLLTANGYHVDFVGTKSDTDNPALPDRDHQGQGGYQIDEIRAGINVWLKEIEDPDVILLLIGTNDFTAGNSISDTQGRLRNLIGELSAQRPFAKIVVSSLLPRTDNPTLEAMQSVYNQSLPGIVSEQVALGRQVYFVDMHSAVDPEDLNDGVHPKIVGYEKMADAWAPVVANVITPLGTSNPPEIARLDARKDLTHLTVKFSKPVEDAAVALSNYSLDGGVAVLEADLDPLSKRSVTLTTGPQVPDTLYTLTVTGVRDRTPQQNLIVADSVRSFTSRTLIDGSFESNGQGWSLSGHNQVDESPETATDGTKLVVFNGGETSTDGVASQVIATTPGKKYKLNFDMGVNGSSTPQALKVNVSGHFPVVSQTEQLSGPGGGTTQWESKNYEFVANSPSTTVTFQDASLTSTNVDLLLDDVRMNLVTTPTLTVMSSPNTGASVAISPNDLNSNGGGVTGFTRTYTESTAVSLTAPATSFGLNFEKWQKDGVDYSAAPGISVTMDASHTLKAFYSILNNGGFELGTPDVNGVIATVPSWTTSGEVFGYVASAPYLPNDGSSRLLVFNGPSSVPSGVVSQSFPTVAGQSYLLEFDMGVLGAAAQQVQVGLAGTASLLSTTDSLTGSGADAPVWAGKSHTFTADSGSTTLTFTDASATSASVDLLLDRVRIHAVEANTAPVAANDAYSAVQGTPLVIAASGVLANDTDAQFNSLTASINAGPAHGSVTLDANGGFTYTPSGSYTGTDTFTYQANDGSLNSNIATVTITITAPPAQLLTNGSFEQGTPDGDGLVANVTGWTGSGNRFGYVTNPPYSPTDGGRLMVFNGGPSAPNGVLTQSFTTVVGQAYLLEFDMGVVGPVGQAQQFAVTVAGTGTLLSQTDTALGNGAAVSAWADTKSHVFVADSTTSILTFTDISSTGANVDLLLDHVRVTTSSARSLAVTSSPASGAAITVTPSDLNANADGATAFTRYYANGASVALTAPATYGGGSFVKWRKNGTDLSTNASINVTMDANYALDAVYLAGNAPPVAIADSYSVIQNTPLLVPAAGVLSNDTDAESNTLIAVLNAGPAHGSLTLNANGGFSYTPTAAYVGADSFTYHANDGTSNSNVVTVSITVNPTGSAILTNGSFESGTTGWTVGGNQFVYTDDGTYRATDGTKTMIFNGGNVVPNAVISQTFPTTPGQTYSLLFDMGVVGGVGQTQEIAVSLVGSSLLFTGTDSAAGTGGPSVANPKSHSFVANSSTTTLTLSDASSTGTGIDLLLDNVRIVASANRTLSVASTPVTGVAVTVTPPDLSANANGVTGFTRTYADGSTVNLTAPLESGVADFQKWQKNGLDYSNSAGVSVVLDADTTMTAVYVVNAAPVAVADSYSATKDTPLAVTAPGVLTNDSDPESAAITAVLNAAPTHGSLTLNADGSFTYTPASGYLGPDSFTYHANDGEVDSNVVTVTISIAAPNSLANGSFEQGTAGWTVSGNQLVASVDGTYLATDGVKMMVFNGGPAVPNAVISQTFATTAGQPYKLELDMGVLALNTQQQQLGVTVSGTATLISQTETASGNGQGNSAYATKTYSFVADSAATTLTLTDLSTATNQIDLLIDNVRITAGAVRSLTVNSPVSGGVNVTVSPTDLSGNGNGTTSFSRSYIAGTSVSLTAQTVAGGGNFLKWQKDGSDYAATTATSVVMDQNTTMSAIYSPNAAPVAVADAYSVNEDVVLTVTAPGILSNDSDPEGGAFTAALNTTTSHGTLALDTAGTFTYTPVANYNGSDSFTYHTNDGSLNSSVVTVTITVNPVNDPPTATAQTLNLDEDTPTPVTLAGTDLLDGDPLTFVVVTPPQHGTLSGTSPNLTYTPAANYNGTDSFTFVANDGTVNSAAALVSINIAPVPDIPIASPQSVSVTGGASAPITLLGSDPDGSPVTFAVANGPAHGTLSGTAPHLVYTPVANYKGSDSFTFTTNDGTSDSLPATVSITVTSILVNGSFEAGATGVSAAVPGWTVSGAYEVATSVLTPVSQHREATDGTKLVVMNTGPGANNSVFSQTFATTPGQPYTLAFDVGIQAFNTSQQKLQTTVQSGASTLISDATTLTGTGAGVNADHSLWVAKSYSFVAVGTSATLTFSDASTVTSLIDLLLDNVRVNAQISRVLTVASSGATAVSVTASPADIFGNGNGTTGFTRTYIDGTVVSLAAPAVIGAKNFQKWQKDGVDLTTNASTTVTMDAARTLTAFYVPNAPPLAVADSYSTNEDVALVVPVAGVLTNDSDPELKPVTAVLDVGPTHGTLVLNANGSFTYTPAANYFGPDSFTYHANDGVVNSTIATVSLTVNSVNDVPVAVADSYSVNEDTPLSVAPATGVLVNDTDVESGPLTSVLNVGPAHGTLTLNPNGSFIYQPSADYNGADFFTYHANDGVADSGIVTVSITVNPVNDAPVATAKSVNTNEDVAKSIALTGTDVDGNPLTFTVVTQPQHGTLSGTVPALTYTPAANYNGPDSFTFKANDGLLDSAVATVSITVVSVNDVPAALAQSVDVNEDGSVAVTLAATDVENDPLTFTVVAQPQHGALTGTPPALTYTPAANYNGADSFTFKANDGAADSPSATVSISVVSVNDAPLATALSVTTDEDVAKSITLAGSDVDGDVLTFSIIGQPQHGVLTGNGSARTYTPAANYFGTDSFTFKVNDGTVDSSAATVSITVAPVNDAPVASAQSLNVDEDGSLPITLSGTDIEGNALTFAVVGQPLHGTLSGTAPALTYNPAANYNGPDSFTFKVNDGTVDSAVVTVSISVAAINDAPVAVAQSVTTDEDVAKFITLAGSDVDANSLTFTVITQPAHGSLTGIAPNLSYTPAANYNGPDSFTFKVNDGTVDSPAAMVSIAVTAVNDVPVALAQSLNVDEDGSLPLTLTGADVEASPLGFTVVTQPLHGTLSGTAPALTYNPAANYNGPDSFTFKVNDGTVDSAVATISISVAAVNDTPVAAAQSVTTDEDVAKFITLTGSDVDGDSLTFTVITPPAHGILTGVTPNLSYTPAADYNGPDSVTFKVNDGSVDSPAATVSITVTAVNDAPLALAQSLNVDEDASLPLILTGSDVEGSPLTFTVVTQPQHGLLTGAAPNLIYTPAANYNGPDSFTFKGNDGALDSSAATISISVLPVNDAPVATAQAVTTDEDVAKVITLAGSDVEGSPLTFAVVAPPQHGVLTGTAPNLTYTPAADYNGPDSFTFKTNDGALDSATAMVSITVTAVNDAPAAAAQSVSTDEDTPKPITLTGSDVDGNTLTFALVTQPSHGALTGAIPDLVYTPVANYNGPDGFTFKVNDGTVDSPTATVSITVLSVNDAPLALSQSVNTDEDVAKAIVLTGSDVEGGPLTFAVVDQPLHGSLTGTAPGLTYTPAANYNGIDSFTFKANDGTVDSATATVSISVAAVNDAPLAAEQSVNVDEDIAKAIVLTGSDIESSPLTFVVIDQPQHGALTGTGADLTYTPSANYHGSDSFTFKVNDGTLDSAPATVAIAVASVNDVPLAVAQSVATDEDTAKVIVLTGSDVDGDTLTFAVVSQPLHGSLTGTAPNLTYTPAANYNGPDSFTFKANDGTADSAPATVSIAVNSVIDDGFATWLAGFGLTGNPGDDPDRDSLTNALEFVVGGNPASRSDVNLLPTVSMVTADPDQNSVNEDYLLFTYRRTDLAKGDDRTTISVQWSGDLTTWADANGTPGAVTVEADDAAAAGVDLVRVYIPRSLAVSGKLFARLKVFIDVPPANVAPVAQPQTLNVSQNVNLSITLTATDANGDALSYQIVGAPQHGTFTGGAPNLVYVPAANYSGPDSFTFKANDGKVDSTPATVSITVNPVNLFNQWLTGYGLSATPGADSDGDSISNAVEYVIGGNPAGQSDMGLLPTVSMVTADPDNNAVSDDYLLFSYRRTDLSHDDPATSIRVQWSADLAGPWTNVVGTPGAVIVVDDNSVASNIDLVRAYIPRSLSQNGRLFARLKVSVGAP